MEIHAPEGPVTNFRELAIHIGIVTIGILIALSLEGIRELIHNRNLVHETRANFRVELETDKAHVEQEVAAVHRISRDLQKLRESVYDLAKRPGVIAQQLQQNSLRNPGYFLSLQSWHAALSTGALAHMDPDEVLRYADCEYSIARYSSFQSDTENSELAARAYFVAHPDLTPAQLADGEEKLLLWEEREKTLAYVVDQVQTTIEDAYKASGQH